MSPTPEPTPTFAERVKGLFVRAKEAVTPEPETGVERLQRGGKDLAEGAEALWTRLKQGVGVGVEGGKGAAGGLVGMVKSAGNTALKLGGVTLSAVGKTWHAIPGVVLGAGVVAGIAAYSSHSKKQAKAEQLEQLTQVNDTRALALQNDTREAQLAAMADNNPDARGGHAAQELQRRAAVPKGIEGMGAA